MRKLLPREYAQISAIEFLERSKLKEKLTEIAQDMGLSLKHATESTKFRTMVHRDIKNTSLNR